MIGLVSHEYTRIHLDARAVRTLLICLAMIVSVPIKTNAAVYSALPDPEDDPYEKLYNSDETVPKLSFVPGPPAYVIYGGEINSSGASALASILAAHPEIKTLVLASYGGDEPASETIIGLVKRYGLNTHAVDECSSSCADILLSGVKRSIAPGAVMVLHWGAINGCEKSGRSKVSCNLEARDYARSMGLRSWLKDVLPKDIWTRMNNGEDVWLTSAKALRSGIVTRITPRPMPFD